MQNILTEEEVNGLLKDTDKTHSDPKECFIDNTNVDYIQLDSTLVVFERLQKVIFESLKIVLIHGKPGTGKTMLLNQVYESLKSKDYSVSLISSPVLDERKLFSNISKKIFNYLPNEDIPKNFISLVEKISEIQPFFHEENKPLILLDEAQLYSDEILEKIRILSDSRSVKFIIVLHQIDNENIFSKEHFKSRVWESIQVYNASRQELKIYIQKKLLQYNYVDLANQFDNKIIKIIHKYTDGNYRITNKLLYTLYETYYEQPKFNRHRKLAPTGEEFRITKKQIEITAIRLGILDAPKEGNYSDQSNVELAEKKHFKLKLFQTFKFSAILLFFVIFSSLSYYAYNLVSENKISEQNIKKHNLVINKKTPKIEQNLTNKTKTIAPEIEINTSKVEEKPTILFTYEEKQQPIVEYNDLFDKDLNNTQHSIKTEPVLMLFSNKKEPDINTTKKSSQIVQEEKEVKEVLIEQNSSEITKLEEQKIIDKNISTISEILKNTQFFEPQIFFEPILNQFSYDELKELIKTDKFEEISKIEVNKTIQNLENRFYETDEISIALKVLNYYFKKRNFIQTFKFASLISDINYSVKEPWIITNQMLKELNQTKYIDLIKKELQKIEQEKQL